MTGVLHVPTSIFAPFVSRIVTPFNWHLAALCLLLQWVYHLAFFQSFSPCNSAALQKLRHLCKSRSGILRSSSRSCLSWIPRMIRSLTSESLRSQKFQVVAKSFKSVMNFSCDSPGSWVREKKLNLSTFSFFFSDYNARRRLLTPALNFFPTRGHQRLSYHKFLSLDCRSNTEIILLSSPRPCRSLPNPCITLILASTFSNC